MFAINRESLVEIADAIARKNLPDKHIPACPFRVERGKRYLHIMANYRLSFSMGILKLSFADRFSVRFFLWYRWAIIVFVLTPPE